MIKFENVHKYLGGNHILKGINLHIKKGETFVLVGPSGTGKSVLLRHIIALHIADEGKIIINNQNIATLKTKTLEKLRSNCGMLFQSGALLNWMNVEENIALPLVETTTLSKLEIQKRLDETLPLVELEDARKKNPSDISGGMKKRAGLARAIITNPDIILYDEPTSGLDPVMSRKIDKLILSLKHKLNITSLVVTHDLQSAFAIADRIAMIYKGEIIECDTVERFKQSKNSFVREFIDAQTVKVKNIANVLF